MNTDESTISLKPCKTILEECSRRPLRVLCPSQVKQIDAALGAIGLNGEVRLIKSKGKLRFITTVQDEETL